ncbi:MAG TPA: transcriptional regulator [Spirochaeta sp.]|nr:transcriptional regulator [Spirochaeta sp.]
MVNQNELGGNRTLISEILSGKREMNLGHIRRLSEKYGVSPEVFI